MTSTNQPLELPAASARAQRESLRSRTQPRRFALPAPRLRSGAASSRRPIRPGDLLRSLRTASPAAAVAAAARPSNTGPTNRVPAARSALGPAANRVAVWRNTSAAAIHSRSRLIERAAPAALPGAALTRDGLMATWPAAAPGWSAAAYLASRRNASFGPANLAMPGGLAPAAAGRLRSRIGSMGAQAARLPAPGSTVGGVPTERIEVAAERTGAAVAEAVVATFERLIPGIVARALAEAERGLTTAI